VNNDGCDSTCKIERCPISKKPKVANSCCGDGAKDVGEECDDGNKNEDDFCTFDCKTID